VVLLEGVVVHHRHNHEQAPNPNSDVELYVV
jgi:hypothetical protein